jgi:hypothetical protein
MTSVYWETPRNGRNRAARINCFIDKVYFDIISIKKSLFWGPIVLGIGLL